MHTQHNMLRICVFLLFSLSRHQSFSDLSHLHHLHLHIPYIYMDFSGLLCWKSVRTTASGHPLSSTCLPSTYVPSMYPIMQVSFASSDNDRNHVGSVFSLSLTRTPRTPRTPPNNPTQGKDIAGKIACPTQNPRRARLHATSKMTSWIPIRGSSKSTQTSALFSTSTRCLISLSTHYMAALKPQTP